MHLRDLNEPISTMSFSLVIPAFNEENRLGTVHSHVFEYIRSHFRNPEIIFVDDGSTDRTYERLLQYQNQNPEMRIIRHAVNLGKGKAVRTGLKAVKGDIVLFSDTDFSTPIEDVEKLLPHLLQGFDVVIGSRGLQGSNVEVRQSFFRDTIGKIGNAFVQSSLLLPFEDTQCGFKLYRSDALKRILPKLTVDGFAFDMEMLTVALAQGLRVAEVPVAWRNAPESKVRNIHILEVLRDVLVIRYRLGMGSYS